MLPCPGVVLSHPVAGSHYCHAGCYCSSPSYGTPRQEARPDLELPQERGNNQTDLESRSNVRLPLHLLRCQRAQVGTQRNVNGVPTRIWG